MLRVEPTDIVDCSVKRSHLADAFRFIIQPRWFGVSGVFCADVAMDPPEQKRLIAPVGNILDALVRSLIIKPDINISDLNAIRL